MGFLLAKIFFMLLVAALLGGWFMYWWLRRHFDDVTSEYGRLQSDWKEWRSGLTNKLGQLDSTVSSIPKPVPTQPVDLAPVLSAIAAIPKPIPPAPPVPVDLGPLQTRLGALETAVTAIRIPEPVKTDLAPVIAAVAAIPKPVPPQPVDLAPVLSAIAAIPKPIPPAPPVPVDLGPLQTRLGALERAVAAIRIPEPVKTDLAPVIAAVAAIPKPVPVQPVDLAPVIAAVAAIPKPAPTPAPDLAPVLSAIAAIPKPVIPAPAQPVDLSGINARLQRLEDAIRAIRLPEPPAAQPAVDLSPLAGRVDALERAVRGIVIPPSSSIDLQPLLQKLERLEALASAKPAAAATGNPSQPLVRSGSKNLLAHAAFGKPDDLKRIKGVKVVMEKMLHDIGVYYFWQIAEWSPLDIQHADERLPAFHGRIERDHWVKQAVDFLGQPGVATKPDQV